jgi:hypothetical protein
MNFFTDIQLKISQATESRNRNAYGFWTKDDGSQMRKFFDEFASLKKFDPLIPENWHSVTKKDITFAVCSHALEHQCNQSNIYQGGVGGLSHFGSSFHRALIASYPEVEFNTENFKYTRCMFLLVLLPLII